MKKPALTRSWIGRCVLPLVVALAFSGTSFAQDASKEEQDASEEEQDVSSEHIERYQEIKKAAKQEKVGAAADQDATGNDPRVFINKWTPFYRSIELDNGLTQQDLTAFGGIAFSPVVGVFYELPLAQYRDFSDVPGPTPVTDAIGVGDVSLKFLYRPRGLDFHYGKGKKKSGSFLFGTDMVFPTGTTDDGLTGNALLLSPIVGLVVDTPAHGFFAMLNLYYFDAYKLDQAQDTSRYVGRWFYMQPLTKPGHWWGAIFVMPEFQPIYDFKTEDPSLWIGVEIGKVFAPGRIGYIKPGWGIGDLEATDRATSFELGFRWFF
jgi:hypothetical protein